MRRLSAFLLITAMLPLLAGCFLVGDFGTYWKTGTVDKLLRGTWEDIVSKKATTLIKEGDHYRYSEDDNPAKIKKGDTTQIKTLKAGKATFLMLKSVTSQALLRYAATKDRLIIYAPNPAKRAEFLNTYGRSKNFQVGEQGIKILTLNKATVAMLGALAGDDSYWKENAILDKIKPGQKTTKQKAESTGDNVPDPFAGITGHDVTKDAPKDPGVEKPDAVQPPAVPKPASTPAPAASAKDTPAAKAKPVKAKSKTRPVKAKPVKMKEESKEGDTKTMPLAPAADVPDAAPGAEDVNSFPPIKSQ